MSSPQKIKGSSWERAVANHLSELYGPNQNFMRSSGSGAYVGGINSSRKEFLHEEQIKNFKGDIVPPPNWKKFNAEAKSYADFPFHLLLSGKCKVLDGWIKQALDAADEHDLTILFMKFNRKGKYVAVPSSYTWKTDNFIYYTSAEYGDWIILSYDDFFKFNKDLFKGYCTN